MPKLAAGIDGRRRDCQMFPAFLGNMSGFPWWIG